MMKQKFTKNFQKPCYTEIDSNKISLNKDYFLIFRDRKTLNPFYIFFKIDDTYHPVNNYFLLKNEMREITKFSGLVFTEPIDLVTFIDSTFNIEDMNFIEKISIALFMNKNKIKDTDFNFNSFAFLKYVDLLNLNDDVKLMLAKNIIPPDLALEFKKLAEQDFSFFIKLVDTFKLTQSQQREVFQSLCELKEDKPFASLIDLNNFHDKDINRKRESLLKFIRSKTMPYFSKNYEDYITLKRKLQLPPKINLVESPYFESKTTKIEIFFKDYHELKRKTLLLLKNLEEKNEIWKEIFIKI